MMLKKIILIFLLLFSFTNIFAQSTLIVDSDPSGSQVYLNGQYLGNTPNSFNIGSSGTYTIVVSINDYYESYSGSVTIGTNETKNIYVELTASKKAEAENKLSETENQLNQLKTKYSDSDYKTKISGTPYTLLNSAKTYFQNGNFETSIKYCENSITEANTIYQAWNSIKDAENDINSYNTKKTDSNTYYKTYYSISSLGYKLNYAKTSFTSGNYDSANDYCNEIYSKIDDAYDIINKYEKVSEENSGLLSELSDSELGLNPPSNIVPDVSNDLSSAKTNIGNGNFETAEKYLYSASSEISEVELEGTSAKNGIISLNKKISDAELTCKNIDSYAKTKADYEDAKNGFELSKECYNNGEFSECSENVENSEQQLENAVTTYEQEKNQVLKQINETENYKLQLESDGIIISKNIPLLLNSATAKVQDGLFDESDEYITSANSELELIEKNWKNAKDSIATAETYFSEMEKENDGIVIKDARIELNGVKIKFSNGEYESIPELCGDSKENADQIKLKYESSKNSLNDLLDKIKMLNSTGYCVHNSTLKYEEFIALHNAGNYEMSIDSTNTYLESIENAEESIENTKCYINGHEYVNILGIWKIPIDYSLPLKKLESSKNEFNLEHYDSSKSYADTSKTDAEDIYVSAIYGKLPILAGSALSIGVIGMLFIRKIKKEDLLDRDESLDDEDDSEEYYNEDEFEDEDE